MKRRRTLLDGVDDQIAPIRFVLGFHTVIHVLGIFVIVLLPYSWHLGTPSPDLPLPAFGLVVCISVLGFVWASLRLAASRPVRAPVLMLLLIPLLMPAGTMPAPTAGFSAGRNPAHGRDSAMSSEHNTPRSGNRE